MTFGRNRKDDLAVLVNPKDFPGYPRARPRALRIRTHSSFQAANRTPLRIAIGAARLIDLVNTLNEGVGTSYKNPKVLLICPPALDPKIEKGPVFAEMSKGGLEKSKQLPPLYEAVAKMGGAQFLNAGSVVSTDGVDGLHLTSESEKKLGAAIVAKVKEILK